jgi:hypothetical protein
MEQIQQYDSGERDYAQIKGGTGPLVYPAAHVYVYWMLYHITDKGTNILLAQRLFGLLYLATLAIVMACYKRANVRLIPREAMNWLTIWLYYCRHHYIFFRCSSYPSGCIAFLYYVSSMTASLSSSCGSRFTSSSGASGRWGV